MATESAKTARAEEDPRIRERSRIGVSAFLDQAADAAFVVDDERTEEALRRSEASFRALIELLPDGVVVHRGAPAIVALSRDVTEQRRLQAQLAQAGRLSQVFLNLVVNAAHSIDEGSPQSNTVKITTKRRGNEVCVAVADTGHGIPHEHLGRLFNPFFTTKAMGLGLSICASIVRAHGGRI